MGSKSTKPTPPTYVETVTVPLSFNVRFYPHMRHQSSLIMLPDDIIRLIVEYSYVSTIIVASGMDSRHSQVESGQKSPFLPTCWFHNPLLDAVPSNDDGPCNDDNNIKGNTNHKALMGGWLSFVPLTLPSTSSPRASGYQLILDLQNDRLMYYYHTINDAPGVAVLNHISSLQLTFDHYVVSKPMTSSSQLSAQHKLRRREQQQHVYALRSWSSSWCILSSVVQPQGGVTCMINDEFHSIDLYNDPPSHYRYRPSTLIPATRPLQPSSTSSSSSQPSTQGYDWEQHKSILLTQPSTKRYQPMVIGVDASAIPLHHHDNKEIPSLHNTMGGFALIFGGRNRTPSYSDEDSAPGTDLFYPNTSATAATTLVPPVSSPSSSVPVSNGCWFTLSTSPQFDKDLTSGIRSLVIPYKYVLLFSGGSRDGKEKRFYFNYGARFDLKTMRWNDASWHLPHLLHGAYTLEYVNGYGIYLIGGSYQDDFQISEISDECYQLNIDRDGDRAKWNRIFSLPSVRAGMSSIAL
jgi:hypothetical protein